MSISLWNFSQCAYRLLLSLRCILSSLASLLEGGGRRPEGVSCVRWEGHIIPATPPQSLRDSMNRGMIATGNHGNSDSLRGAQPQRRSQGASAFMR